jgi:hypothetical protein
MARLIIIIKILIVLLLSVASFTEFNFSAREEVGESQISAIISFKDTDVITIYDQGPFVTLFSRAQMIAYRLNEYIKSQDDLSKIRFSYPRKIYTASIGEKSLFSIYPKDALNNKMNPESLMSDWINSLKVKFINTQKEEIVDVSKNESVKQPSSENLLTDNIKNIYEANIISAKKESIVTNQYKEMLIDDIFDRLDKIENSNINYINSNQGSSLPKFQTFLLIINLFLIVFLLLKYKDTRKQLGSYSEIESVSKLEELENSVSMLLKELKDVTEEISEKTITKKKEITEDIDINLAELTIEKTNIHQESSIDYNEDDSLEMPIVENKNNDEEEDLADTLANLLKDDITEKDKEPISQEIMEINNYEIDKLSNKDNKTEPEKLAEELDSLSNNNPSNKKSVDISNDLLSNFDEKTQKEITKILNQENTNKNDKIIMLNKNNIEIDYIAKLLNTGNEEISLVLQLNALENI